MSNLLKQVQSKRAQRRLLCCPTSPQDDATNLKARHTNIGNYESMHNLNYKMRNVMRLIMLHHNRQLGSLERHGCLKSPCPNDINIVPLNSTETKTMTQQQEEQGASPA